ncbi:hypothetical protein N7540_010296 [Penicillium herquei]|nr:hypothetical protein N7540_010296 [Penicillium herquei]
MAHEVRPCTVDNDLNDVLLFAWRKHWQRCFSCHALVEKVGGCTHMSIQLLNDAYAKQVMSVVIRILAPVEELKWRTMV